MLLACIHWVLFKHSWDWNTRKLIAFIYIDNAYLGNQCHQQPRSSLQLPCVCIITLICFWDCSRFYRKNNIGIIIIPRYFFWLHIFSVSKKLEELKSHVCSHWLAASKSQKEKGAECKRQLLLMCCIKLLLHHHICKAHPWDVLQWFTTGNKNNSNLAGWHNMRLPCGRALCQAHHNSADSKTYAKRSKK